MLNSRYNIHGIIYANDAFDGKQPVLYVKKESFKDVEPILDLFNIRYPGVSTGEQALLDFYSKFYNLQKNPDLKDDIIILLDEPELYFHPEWQRELISRFIKFFKEFYSEKNVQIILTSNSPYILSDLPKENVILLGKDTIENTFGDNIYSLLKNEYFMDYTIGEFARNKINNIIDKINGKNSLTDEEYRTYTRIIDMIGDKLVRNKLKEMIDDKNKFSNRK